MSFFLYKRDPRVSHRVHLRTAGGDEGFIFLASSHSHDDDDGDDDDEAVEHVSKFPGHACPTSGRGLVFAKPRKF